jgi:hypothetical protein
VQFRLGFGETNKTKGSSKKANLKEKTSSLFLGFARLEQLEGSKRQRRSAGESWHFVVGL